MKRILIVLFLMGVLTSSGSSAEAVTWSYDFESLDESFDVWEPDVPTVETGAAAYDYEWEMTEAEIRIEPGGVPSWVVCLPSL